MSAWAIRDSNGQILGDFLGASRIEVGRKIMPTRYDAFRLHVSASYREVFERSLQQVLVSKGWQIVRTKGRKTL